MSDWQDIFQSRDILQPGADFEEQVFFKIRKKKRLRKIGYGATVMGSLLLLFSLLQIFRPAVRPILRTNTDTPVIQKEEIPLRDDLFFSTFDSHTRYSIEPVSLKKKPKSNDIAINQI
ncbi:MAG: hypothetical protein NTZ12_04500 [Candidatus Aminicenantes bacterium]|nr:hypothetical protein [Candidatus Aminicenantes bacterium]